MSSIEDILDFWFVQTPTENWWKVDPDFDTLLRTRFLGLLLQAAAGELHAWRDSPRGRLAEVIVLDQFSRNIHRGTPAAFAQDPMALVLAQEAVRAGATGALAPTEANFLLMPYMHSESRAIHELAVPLFATFAPDDNLQFELRHKAIIDRFGRYPHRNSILGRESTPEEELFLTEPGSAF
ncbi:DUF924 family protein [Arenimonas daejeonensis]|uniref:DUF924 family protein n=1 Tax=Arenimonas daejeonensis TaxID=370777 RepID=UPI0011BED05C|nr:DUF924 family protein [Arenimonas daejeonensis]